MTDGQRPSIERITIQVRLEGKQPIEYVLEGADIARYCGIGWGINGMEERNLFEFVSGLPKAKPENTPERTHVAWHRQHSPLPAFLLKLPDCDCNTPHDVWGF